MPPSDRAGCGHAGGDQGDDGAHKYAMGSSGAAETRRSTKQSAVSDNFSAGDMHPHGREKVSAGAVWIERKYKVQFTRLLFANQAQSRIKNCSQF